MFSCDVEQDASSNKHCRLRQDDTEDFDWTCNRGVTPQGKRSNEISFNGRKYPATGPASARSGVNYLYAGGTTKLKIARQGPTQYNDQAVIIVQQINECVILLSKQITKIIILQIQYS